MPQQINVTSPDMKASSPLSKKRSAQKAFEKTQMEESENEALSYFKRYYKDKDDDPSLEKKFATAIKKSPSALTIDLGILFAAGVGWHAALEELFLVDVSSLSPITLEELDQHPLRQQGLTSLFSDPLAGSSHSRRYPCSALLHAIVTKKVETVRIMMKHMNPNIDDTQGRPLSYYLFSLDDKEARKQMVDVILPKLRPSIENLHMASAYGDFESTKNIIKRVHPKDKYRAILAGKAAIMHGHDNIAKWVIDDSGVVDWENDGGALVDMAIEYDNLSMLEFLSERSPAFPIQVFGYDTASELWEYSHKVDRPELFDKFIYPPPQPFEMANIK